MKNTIIILVLTLLPTGIIAQDCFSLQNSITCPAYSNFYISLDGNVNRYPFLANVSDIPSFDAQLLNYVNSAGFYLQQLGCTNKATMDMIPYARYSLTYMCASLIQDSLYSLPCNYQNNLNPPPLCQSTCFDWTASVEEITNNVNVCPNQVEQLDQLSNINSTCQSWSGLNGTTNCVIGLANEPNYCGFSGLATACNYCNSNGTDSCCQSVTSDCNRLSTGGIIGIIIGCLIFTGLIGSLFYFFYYKKKNNNRSKNGFILNQKVEHHHLSNNDSSSALGYESLAASQNALIPFHTHHQSTSSLPPPPPPPPLLIPTTTIGNTTTSSPMLEEFFQVKHPYPPQMGDELGLHVGDIVCVAMNFDDGWALGFNVTTGLKGVFPVVCVTPAPEELLEQLLYKDEQPTTTTATATATITTTKTLVEDGTVEHLNMQRICENLRRSMSVSSTRKTTTVKNTLPTSELTQHSHIPRRTASIMRNSYDYRESDSPTSPTLHTPFFVDSGLLSQPEPALFQPIETYEMYRKNNRVSKLEEEEV